MRFDDSIDVLIENAPKNVLKAVVEELKECFGFRTSLKRVSCGSFFQQKFGGFVVNTSKIRRRTRRITVILTNRELFQHYSKNKNQWINGESWFPTIGDYSWRPVCVISLRHLGSDASKLARRALNIVIHEVGHVLLGYRGEPKHYKRFIWVGKSGKEDLKPHCSDKRCVMYQNPGVKSPPLREGHMLVGGVKTRGIGLDELNKSIYRGWFCPKCRSLLSRRLER